jgi:hypothetical protein
VIDANPVEGYNYEIVEELGELMPSSNDLLDIRYTNTTEAMGFDKFG